MTDLRKAAEMALRRLDFYYVQHGNDDDFTALIALRQALAQPDEIHAAVLAERDACAKAVYDSTDWAHEEQDMTLKETIAAAIRAREDKHD